MTSVQSYEDVWKWDPNNWVAALVWKKAPECNILEDKWKNVLCTHVCEAAFVWRPEVDPRCLSQLFSTPFFFPPHFFETVFFTEPGAQWLASKPQQWSYLSPWSQDYRLAVVHLTFTRVLTKVLMLTRQALYWLSHLPSSCRKHYREEEMASYAKCC